MRVLVFFDLPTESLEDKREYRKFRKNLIKRGFLMLQESVYVKLALNQTVAQTIIQYVRSCKPAKGLVQMLVITEKQYARMEQLVGETKSAVIDTDEKVIVI